jgi:stage V sporulation protein AA
MDTVYLKLGKHREVHHTLVTLGDIAEVWSQNTLLKKQCEEIVVVALQPKDGSRTVGSILQLIAKIQEIYPEIEIENLGESDFIVEYQSNKKHSVLNAAKALFVCAISLIGAAFAIMTFNNDGDVVTIFTTLTTLMTGEEPSGIMPMEVAYAVGMPVGIILFFNHFSQKQVTHDPTPIEVQMRLYEDNVCHTLVENQQKKEAE